MRAVLFGILCAALAGCGHSESGTGTTGSPCANGLCGTSGGGGSGTGAASASAGTGACVESWGCTPWQQGGDGTFTRMCVDADGCGTTLQKPNEGPVKLPDLDVDYFRCKVEPVLDGGCAMLGCHGTESGRALKIYARGRLRHKETVAQVPSCPVGPQQVDLADMGTATVMCVGWSPHTAAEWQSNYDSARSFMVGLTDPEQSDLLAQPVYGGKAHAGVHLFAKGDPDYETLKSWLGGAKLGMACDPSPN